MANDSDSSKSNKNSAALLHDATITPRDNRRGRGQALRGVAPLESIGDWKPAADRPCPLDVLAKNSEGRIEKLIPLRYGRMLPSPFTFFRGAAAVMAEDISHTLTTEVKVQICGDMHLLNFGAFATPERNVAFDINDFDETLPAPWEYDLERLTVSFILAARENGLKEKHGLNASRAVVSSYREKMKEYSKMSILDIWYDRIDWKHVIESTSSPDAKKRREKALNKAMRRNSEFYFPKLVDSRSEGFQIKDQPPRIFHPEDGKGKSFKEKICDALEEYKGTLQEDKRRLFGRYRYVDSAIKVVGIGSVGTMCSIALLLAPDDEPLFLQIKEARPSVFEPFVGKSSFDNRGQRVVEGQRIMQSASDIFLGWTKFDEGKHFYVRQLRDTKIKLEPELWDGKIMLEMARIMGAVLARAHARSGDSAVISGYLGDDSVFDEAMTTFAVSYANQVEKDHARLVEACKSGKLEAEIEAE